MIQHCILFNGRYVFANARSLRKFSVKWKSALLPATVLKVSADPVQHDEICRKAEECKAYHTGSSRQKEGEGTRCLGPESDVKKACARHTCQRSRKS